ncbi:MAG: T9SS type A sorting domain-containing protein, partial [Tannerella sp.]|jgi:hypothetical protein|nr:T9SS type A sorting domain-containing protein [Tannerella sp.]
VGSFVIQFPSGFTLDKANTSLTADYGKFELKITQKENNACLFEIKPKTLRSALRAGEAGTLAHIAYTVNNSLKKGTYTISVNSILFETPGGASIVEPAITVPVQLSRGGVGNEAIDAPTSVYIHDGLLYIKSDRAQPVTVYAVSGAKLYESILPAGATTLDVSRYPKGVYIVVFADGTRWKVIR